jgi:hypothetical protein
MTGLHRTGVRLALVGAGALALSLTAIPRAAVAQATVSLDVQDPAYRDIDRLIADGVIQTAVVGMRPYSRREIARLIAEAGRAREAKLTVSAGDQRVIDRLRTRFAGDLRLLAGDSTVAGVRIADWRIEALGIDAPERRIPYDSVGSVEANLNPLLNGRGGRRYGHGLNLGTELELDGRASRNIVVRVRPRIDYAPSNTFNYGRFEALSATALYKNILIEAGRQPLVWGQGMEGGLLASTSGPPLDMIRIANDTPFYAPSFLHVLGPIRATLFVADLGTHQRFPHSNIIGYKLSGTPFTRRFELSASVLSEQGGRGAPAATLWDHLEDLIPALKYALPDNNSQFSNKFAGWEYRYRIPEWRGLQLYAEHQFDDMDPRRWRSTLWEDGGHIAGISLQNVAADGALSAAAEFHHTGLRYYEHRIFNSGVAFDRTLLGDPLGPKGDGGYLRLMWDAGGEHALTLDAAVERRFGNIYQAISNSAVDESDFHFIVLEHKPAEWRRRVVGTWVIHPAGRRRITLQAGYERVRNFNFSNDANRNNVMAAATFDLLRW